MLGVAPLRNTKDERVGEKIETSFNISGNISNFTDFSGDYLLDFDDLFVGMEDEDVLPALEMDTEILNDFSISGGDESEIVNFNTSDSSENIDVRNNSASGSKAEDKVSGSDSGSSNLNQDVSSKREKSTLAANPSSKEGNKGKKSSKNHQGKRKVKVDWTPELHRRFVQAVEQLGVDKAVPSRILELMGIDCLTRHNIASHLQKYRSHRKHLLAREAEAASWSQRRQIYGGVTGGCKPEISNPWFAPRIGFPPVGNFRPLHVWGHPSSMDKRHVWPKHVHPPNSQSQPPPLWAAPAPSSHPSFSLSHLDQVRNCIPAGAPCFPPSSLAPTKFAGPTLVPGVPPHPIMYTTTAVAAGAQPLPHPPSNYHPSKESIDAAIEDVLTKPWLPLPLGLKPPSTDSVVVELHRQGIDKVPPTTTTNSNT